ncbi:esterase E4-like [Phymastichus coffea]|uniref:esterase E4-like n=1 Tax=Phymastichus coffea TaxID=108790 RepID=UPI00273BE767|nr:esterase E4-like [Phymastichus coffea]XP_058799388.1 esterase E4-like [Phymastichus coffea]
MSDDQLIVETKAGKVRGAKQRNFEGNEFYAFRGIPYAKPPVKELRFQDPEPVEPWPGIREAMSHGPNCAQVDIITSDIIGSDDCLYLNIYAKNLKSDGRRPVMFWIHGGGFTIGYGDDSMYGPDYFMRKDVVLITINYRLGCLGFLNLNDEVATGNQGLKDQVMALQWVRDNIANFGGDPNNVTIFGESAGAASVHYLTLSPLAKGLFHKAIAQSGVALNPWAFKTDPEECAYRLCELLGHTEKDPKSAIEFLKEVDIQKLIGAQGKILKKEERFQFVVGFGPTIDIKSKQPFMPAHPEEIFTKGIEVPLIIGYNNREGIIFLRVLNKVVNRFEAEFDTLLHPKCVDTIRNLYNLTLEKLKQIYFENDEITVENIDKLVDLFGDLHFVEGIHRVLQTQIEKNSTPTYFYLFNYDKDPSLLKMISRTNISGASHTDEIFYLFAMQSFTTMRQQYGIPRKSWYQLAKWFIRALPLLYLVKWNSFRFPKKGTVRYRISEQMIDMWVNFAITGKPTNGPSELIPVDWPPVDDGKNLRYLNICENLHIDVVPHIEEKYNLQKDYKS